MSVELIPCRVDRDFFMCLAEEYVDALHEYDDRIVWDDATWSKSMWDSEFIVDGGVLCGFVLPSEIRFKNKPRLLFIDEFYVAPGERRRGVGMEAVKALIKGRRGDVGLYILDRNEPGKAFWNAVEKECNFARTERTELRKEDGCELRVYRIPT